MARQTEKRKKSSKKNYSFTGHRIIGNNKSNFVAENSLSDGSTTEDIKQILESENGSNSNFNRLGGLLGNQQNMQQNGMQMMNNNVMPTMANMPTMGNMQMMNNIPMMGHNGMPMMGQIEQNKINNYAGEIDPIMVNTLAPLNNDNFNMNMNSNNLMGPSQMAQSLSSLANLSKLSNSQNNYGDSYFNQNNSNLMMQNQQQFTPQNMTESQMMTQVSTPNFRNLAALNNIKMI